MFFEDIKIGNTVKIAPAVIEKEKMIAFAKDYDMMKRWHLPLMQ